MSRPPNPPSGRTSPARPLFKADHPSALVCGRLKPDGTLCGERFCTLKGFLSHGRSLKKHAAPGFVPPQPRPQTPAPTPPQQDDHPGLLSDGPASRSDFSLPLLLEAMPYVELLDLQVQVANTVRRRHCALMDNAMGQVERQTLHVSTPPQPTTPTAEKNEEEAGDLLALAGEDGCLYVELLNNVGGFLPCDDRS